MTVLALAMLAPTSLVLADGVQDNLATNVRRIPELGISIPADRETQLRARLSELQAVLTTLAAKPDHQTVSLLPDILIFERAVRCALDYQEFFDLKELDKADELITEGLARSQQLVAGRPEWIAGKGLVVRGYISRIDQTVQPYGLVIPATYATDHSVPTRCDIWFHGRGEKLSEVNFLWDRMKNPGEFAPAHTIVLHPYGRYCNAFKFAGEIDVLEGLADVQSRYRIDENQVSVRGFSMGGAACWQFATHYSDRWFAASPGAGFSETPLFLKVFQKEELRPTVWEQTLWNMYDCDKWASNLRHCPTIAYSGENDSQKQAADVMETALRNDGIQLRHIIGAGMGHRYDSPSKNFIEQSLASLALSKRQTDPSAVDLTTYSLRYNRMHWITIDGMTEHWKPARIQATHTRDPNHARQRNIAVVAGNVSAFSIDIPANPRELFHVTTQIVIHPAQQRGSETQASQQIELNAPLSDGSLSVHLHMDESGQWQTGPLPSGLRKRHKLQGPIDDAFMDSFVFVRPTGNAAHDAVGKWAEAELKRAVEHWRRHFRGDARVVNDVDVTENEIQSANLILWGDVQSNAVLKKIAHQFPIQWTADQISVGDRSFDSTHHVPVLVYPNPLNGTRYVVLNSSFTFRDYAYLNNARQVSMLPDWAVIDLNTPPGNIWPGHVVAADFFDEQWAVKSSRVAETPPATE